MPRCNGEDRQPPLAGNITQIVREMLLALPAKVGDLMWHLVRADDKKLARLNVIRYLLSRVACPDKDRHLAQSDLDSVFDHTEEHVQSGAIVS
jgi:hypothetical protein